MSASTSDNTQAVPRNPASLEVKELLSDPYVLHIADSTEFKGRSSEFLKIQPKTIEYNEYLKAYATVCYGAYAQDKRIVGQGMGELKKFHHSYTNRIPQTHTSTEEELVHGDKVCILKWLSHSLPSGDQRSWTLEVLLSGGYDTGKASRKPLGNIIKGKLGNVLESIRSKRPGERRKEDETQL